MPPASIVRDDDPGGGFDAGAAEPDAGRAGAGEAADADADADAGGGDAGSPSSAFSIVVLPDTQFYASSYPQIFDAQADWIAANKVALNIAFVMHSGDIVDADVRGQWEIAARSLHRLDDVVPYFLAPGNHDYGTGLRDTMIDAYFPVSGFSSRPWFGGTFEPDR